VIPAGQNGRRPAEPSRQPARIGVKIANLSATPRGSMTYLFYAIGLAAAAAALVSFFGLW
jgi:hypothetical protein